MVGSDDPLFRTADLKAAWEPMLPGARFQVIPGAGRLPHLSHPEVLAAALAVGTFRET